MTYELLICLIGLVCLVGLIVIRVPLAYAMILVGGIGVSVLDGPNVMSSQLKDLAYLQFSIFDLTLFPMFVYMGNLAGLCGLSRRLFRAAHAWVGHVRGGIAMSVILACAGFGSICGSSLATTSTMGKVSLPELRHYNYHASLATGTMAAGGLLGILIPPSIVLVIYSVLVGANIITMFKAAMIPGLIALVFFLAAIAIFVRIHPEAAPVHKHTRQENLLGASLGVIPVVLIFSVVIGGIYFEIFKPTPAAALGVFMVAAYGLAVGELNLAKFKQALLSTARSTGLIYLILLGAEMLKIFMVRGHVPEVLSAQMLGSGFEPLTILIIFLMVLIVLGCVMDSLSILLLVVPFFWPVIAGLDFDLPPESVKIWFGILVLIVVEIGLITPPIGLNVFVVSALSKDIGTKKVFIGVMPFLLAEFIRIGLLIAFPALVLWLPFASDT